MILPIAAALAGAWMMGLVVTWAVQERIVFRPPPRPGEPEPIADRGALVAADGVRTYAYVLGARQATGPVVLAFHGNADLARWMVPWARTLASRIHGTVVVPEYRGYDSAEGRATCAGVAVDARAAREWIRESLPA